ncbi:MAG TPA: PKD domain-containing protein [Dehalococcoidia bacterium]
MGRTPRGIPGSLVIIAASLAIALSVAAVGTAGAMSRAATQTGSSTAFQQSTGPRAVFSDTGDVSVATPVRLDAGASQGDTLTYSWVFGDGTATATGASVQHAFAYVDDYRVVVTVMDRQGNVDTASQTIRVVPTVQTLTGEPQLGQIVPASSFTAFLSLNASGPAQVSLTVGGQYLSSDKWDFEGSTAPALYQIPDIRVANEDNGDIADKLLNHPGASIPLTNNVNITLTYPVSSRGTESATYTMSLGRPQSSPPPVSNTPQAAPIATVTPQPQPSTTAVPPPQPATWSITYPNYLPIIGRPVNEDDVNDYYLKGDSQFHAVDAPTLRRWAIKMARNGGVFPDDPQRAADNIYRYVNGLLGIGDPGDLEIDLTILGRVENGVLVPGARKGEYICIAHAYFLSSLIRTLGLPDRELTIGFGRGVNQDATGAWKLNFYQESANEVWYTGAWHHYDTWIGTRDRADYLDTNLTEITWYAFSEQHTPFIDINGGPVGLAGHDFALGKFVGSPGSPEQWQYLEQQTRPNVRLADPGPEAYATVERAEPAPRSFETVVAGIASANAPAGQ